MDIPQIDRSNYLKGLLITAKVDKQLTDPEKKIIKEFSDKLGFSSDFSTNLNLHPGFLVTPSLLFIH